MTNMIDRVSPLGRSIDEQHGVMQYLLRNGYGTNSRRYWKAEKLLKSICRRLRKRYWADRGGRPVG